MTRRQYLELQKQLGRLTDADRAELREFANEPEAVGEKDAHGNFSSGVMIVPAKPFGETHDEQIASFIRDAMHTDGHKASDDEVAEFVAGKIVAPVGQMTEPVEPDDEQQATDAGAIVAEPVDMPADDTPGNITRHEADEESKRADREHAEQQAIAMRSKVRAKVARRIQRG